MVEKTAHGPGDHDLFICGDDAYSHSTLAGRNQRRIPRVLPLDEFEPKEIEVVANSLPDNRGIFSNASGKDDCVQTAQNCGERSDPFPHLVTKEFDRFPGLDIGTL